MDKLFFTYSLRFFQVKVPLALADKLIKAIPIFTLTTEVVGTIPKSEQNKPFSETI
jgi:hypothetical protein